MENKQGALHILVSTKGGVGKTTIATNIISGFLHSKTNQVIDILEVDNNNVSNSLKSSTAVNFKSFNLLQGEDKIAEQLFKVLDGKNAVIDAGGGDDSLKVIEIVANLMMIDDSVFYIPFLKNKSGMKNVIQTYKAIRLHSESAKIVFVFNQVSELKEDSIKDEFVYFFGDNSLGIKGILNDIKDTNYLTVVIKDSNIFDFADQYNRTAYEISKLETDKTFLLKERKKGLEAFKKATSFLKVVSKTKEYYNKCISPLFLRIDKFLK